MRLSEKTATAQQIEVEIARGADPNARIEGGFTPLHWAVYKGKAETVEALARAGANPKARNKEGSTPLHFAAAKGTAKTVNALLDAGANPKARDKNGRTPFGLEKHNNKLAGTDAYWRLQDARFD